MLLLSPALVAAHPGRTDSNGGHTCRTNCEKWGLEYGEYHYHNGGPAKPAPRATVPKSTPKPAPQPAPAQPKKEQAPVMTKPKPNPKPQTDFKQKEADQHYNKALDLYREKAYADALAELEKIEALDKQDNKSKTLVQKTLAALLKEGERAKKENNFKLAKENFEVLLAHDKTDTTSKEKAKKQLAAIEQEEKFNNLLKQSELALDQHQYKEALKHLNQAKEIHDTHPVSAAFMNVFTVAAESADLAYEKKEFKKAETLYEFLIQEVTNEKDKHGYQDRLKKIKEIKQIGDTFDIDIATLQGDSLYSQLMAQEIDKPYTKELADSIRGYLNKSKTQKFIYRARDEEIF